MNLIAWALGISLLILLMVQAVEFHHATVCRQEAWLKGTELITRSLLTKAPLRERTWHVSCKYQFLRLKQNVTWQKIPSFRKYHLQIPLEGEL
jgi:hypothetical protein